MSPQSRSAGAVFCIVSAMLSLITAVILSAVALAATSQVAAKPVDTYGNTVELFEEVDCDTEADSPSEELYWDCLAEHEATMLEEAALWETEVAARQADITAMGNLALVFGLLGVTFAVCAVAARRREPTRPAATDPADRTLQRP